MKRVVLPDPLVPTSASCLAVAREILDVRRTVRRCVGPTYCCGVEVRATRFYRSLRHVRESVKPVILLESRPEEFGVMMLLLPDL